MSRSADQRPLPELLRAGPLGARALHVLEPAAQALDALHDEGRVHGTLTPDAVLVEPQGDVTLAPAEQHVETAVTAEDTDSTRTGQAAAVPVYRAPEQDRSGVVSHRSDLYAFACIAFEAVTGSPAFTTATLPDRQAGLLPSAAGDGRPAALDRVFADAFARAPEDRPSSAAAFVASLAAAFGDTYRPRAGRTLRRWVAVSAAAAGAAVLAAALAAVLATGSVDAEGARTDTQSEVTPSGAAG